jgi:hypothetical protein
LNFADIFQIFIRQLVGSMKKLASACALVLVFMPSAPAVASCLDDVSTFAIRICGEIDKSGKASTVDASGKLDASVSNIITRIAGGGSANVSGSVLVKTFENVTQDQLGNELFNVRECREKMVDVAVKQVCQKPPTYKTCSRPEFGQAGWARSEEIAQTSGWVGGGSNPANWCNELINQTISGRAIGPQHEVKINDKGESSKRDVMGHVSYNYSCKITIQWEPVYNQRQDPLCGTE